MEKIKDFSKVINSLNKIKSFKDELKSISDMISSLPSLEDLTVDDSETIYVIKYRLSKFTNEEINEYVSNYQTFTNTLDKLEELISKNKELAKVEEIINSIVLLPEYSEVTILDKEKINVIVDSFDKLSSDLQGMVINYYKIADYLGIISDIESYDGFNPYKVLASISDVATSYTCDKLYNEGCCEILWHSSSSNLYYFENGYGKVSRVYQTHKKQIVEIKATVKYKDQVLYELSKEVTVDPVLFDDISTVPVATYFQTTALNSYYSYSNRYKEEKTLFSDKAKEVLDIIYYAFGHLDGSGNIRLSDEGIVSELVKTKEYGVRNVLCLAGVDAEASRYFTEVTANDNLRKNFVNNIMDFLERYNFDGVDVDWESVGDYPVLAFNLNLLIKDLKEEMINRQDPNGSPYLLTIAIPATIGDSDTNRFDYETLNNYVDYYNVMSYALNDVNKSTHLTALYSSSYDNGRGLSADNAVKLVVSRGADITKLIIGSGAYGKSYQVEGESTNPDYPGLGLSAKIKQMTGIPNAYASGTLFLNAIYSLISTGKYTKYLEYNDEGKLVGSYLYNEEDKIFVTYDSEEMIKAKYQYASDNGLGIICWAYTQDTYDDFVNTIYDEFLSE